MDSEHIITPDDIGKTDYEHDLGTPGEFPFTRGIYPEMYAQRLWTMRQYAGFGDAEGTNARFRYLLEQGQTGLSVAFDLPTQLGYDSDHPMARDEVGNVGVAVSTLEDMRTIFRGIDHVQAAAQNCYGAAASVQAALVGRSINAAGQAAYHGDPTVGQILGQTAEGFGAVIARSSGPHHS